MGSSEVSAPGRLRGMESCAGRQFEEAQIAQSAKNGPKTWLCLTLWITGARPVAHNTLYTANARQKVASKNIAGARR